MILVTGASGTAGQAVLKAIRDCPGADEVVAATRSGRPRSGERQFDFADAATWTPALEDVRAIFLMLPPGLPKARGCFRELLLAARRAGTERVTFLSVRNSDRLTFLPHHGLEQEIEGSGLGWTHLRPNDWMQNFATQPLYRDDIANGELWAPNGGSRTSYIDVRDVAAVAAQTLGGGYDGRALALSGPAELDLGEVAERLAGGIGHRVVNRQPSLPGFLGHALRRRQPLGLAAVMASIGLIARLGYARGIDPTVAEVLGREPTSFERFVADYRSAWKGPAAA